MSAVRTFIHSWDYHIYNTAVNFLQNAFLIFFHTSYFQRAINNLLLTLKCYGGFISIMFYDWIDCGILPYSRFFRVALMPTTKRSTIQVKCVIFHWKIIIKSDFFEHYCNSIIFQYGVQSKEITKSNEIHSFCFRSAL